MILAHHFGATGSPVITDMYRVSCEDMGPKGVVMAKKYKDIQGEPGSKVAAMNGAPFNKSAPLRVSFGVYIISLVVIALAIFILMLIQYFPGYRSNYKMSKAVNNSNVSLSISIPMSEVEKRKENPFSPEQRKEIESLLKGMGAKTVTVKIEPQ